MPVHGGRRRRPLVDRGTGGDWRRGLCCPLHVAGLPFNYDNKSEDLTFGQAAADRLQSAVDRLHA